MPYAGCVHTFLDGRLVDVFFCSEWHAQQWIRCAGKGWLYW